MKREFIVNRQGKDFVLYTGLLDQAHAEGLSSIITTLIQSPTNDNGGTAIVHARVTTSKGTFDGIGDANSDNVGRMIAMHAIRMAETRAKARALRDAINVGVAAFEELGDVEEEEQQSRRQQQRPAPAAMAGRREPIPMNPNQADSNGEIKPRPTDPAPADWVAAIHKLNEEYTTLTMDGFTIPAAMTRQGAEDMGKGIRAEIAKAREVLAAEARGGAAKALDGLRATAAGEGT